MQSYAKSADGVLKVTAPPKPRCARIHYEGDFHIDVPSYHLDPDANERTLAAESGWEISDPKAIYLWFKDCFDDTTRGKVRRQICYLKCWSQLKWEIGKGRPSSVLLTVMVADAYARLTEDDLGSDDDTLLATLRRLSARVKRSQTVRNPANPSENLNRLSDEQWRSFQAAVDDFIEVAERACAADNEIEAVDLWSSAFAHFFPGPELSTSAQSRVAKSNALVLSADPDVAVMAVATNNKNIRFQGTNSLPVIPKGCQITFRLLEPGRLPSGATVEWVVRNEGSEAENRNDLGHRVSNRYTAIEESRYAGRHYMDCLIRHNGRLIGMRRIPVTIDGMSAPYTFT